MDQSRAPLFEKLVQVRQTNPVSFHVPGHKSGQGIAQDAAAWFAPIMSLDMTEITGLDDLHAPEGVIREAQQLAARCFGAAQTFFLVGGSTAGNLAMILAVCDRGDTLIVQRDAHKSVIHGLMLAGAKAVFIGPRVDEHSGLSLGVAPEDLERALNMHPEAKGVLLTNPSYYGVHADLQPLARIVHARGLPLLVDEAHGAHFGFHPALPPSAMAGGADVAVQSAHKMLHSLTMGAMLHVADSGRVSAERIAGMLAMVQSSSPSYPIMASLDLCRRDMALHGRELLDGALRRMSRLRDALSHIPWIGVAQPKAAGAMQDPFKLALYDATGALSGFELRDRLEERGLMMELADPRHVLLAFSWAVTDEDTGRLIRALQQMSSEFHMKKQEPAPFATNIQAWTTRISEPLQFELPNRSSHERADTRLPLRECIGFYAAEMVIPYPPGIPILYPGEAVTAETVDYLEKIRQAGGHVQGAGDPTLQTLLITARSAETGD